ncbi:MAG: DUF177 domain-containing protein [Chlorobiaceae bacterium]
MYKEKSLIEIPFTGFGQGTLEFDFTCRIKAFNDELFTVAGLTGDIKVQAIVTKSERDVTVTIKTSTTAELNCDICFSPISQFLTGTFTIYYIFGEHSEEEHSRDKEYRIIEKNAVLIDITEEVRDTLLLSIPMKIICKGNPNCKLYKSTQANENPQADNISSWQESLEKLKHKYR